MGMIDVVKQKFVRDSVLCRGIIQEERICLKIILMKHPAIPKTQHSPRTVQKMQHPILKAVIRDLITQVPKTAHPVRNHTKIHLEANLVPMNID